MPLVFAGITPHPSLLIPTIGKDAYLQLEKTQRALKKLEHDLYLAKPQRIIIISPHEGVFGDTFAINAHDTLHSHFEAFGDRKTTHTWQGAPELGAKIEHKARRSNIPIRLISNEKIGHGASVPLLYLTTHLKDVKILPIGYSNLDSQAHVTFGHLVKEVIMESDKRIAIICSGDMARTLTDTSPAGFRADGAWFDSTIRSLLATHDRVGIKELDAEKVRHADECLYRSLLILCGVLGHMKCEFEEYAYEAPFGVGYLTGVFHL